MCPKVSSFWSTCYWFPRLFFFKDIGCYLQNSQNPLILVNSEVFMNPLKIFQGILQPWVRGHFWRRTWIFRQNSSSAHKAKVVQGWYSANLPCFNTSQLLPPYSLYLNPMDSSFWYFWENCLFLITQKFWVDTAITRHAMRENLAQGGANFYLKFFCAPSTLSPSKGINSLD